LITLRHFQKLAVNACFAKLATVVAQVLKIATGGGKTVVMAFIAKRIREQWKKARIILISHVQELIEQDSAMMEAIGLKVAIYANALGRKETEGDVVCAMIQSIHRTNIFYDTDFIIIDECHTASHEFGMYKNFIEKCKAKNPNVRIIGFTATPYRLKGGSIVGEGKLFDEITYQITTEELQDMGWLKRLNYSILAEGQVDTADIKKIAGDFNLGQLSEKYSAHDLVAYHAKLASEIAKKRKTWLAFCVDIQHCELVAEELRKLGIPSYPVHSELDNKTRTERIEAFKRGEIRCLTSVATLTTGFDTKIDGVKHVEIDCLISLRPTMSKTLWEQIKGRGTRPVFASGMPLETNEERLEAIAKSTHPNCLVVSFCGNPARFEDADDPKEKKKKNGDAPVKTCPTCGNQIHASKRICGAWHEEINDYCQHEFDIQRKNDIEVANFEPTLKKGERWWRVDGVHYSKHDRKQPPSMRVDYSCVSESGMSRKIFSEWVCLEHDGYAKQVAQKWWYEHYKKETMPVIYPETIEKALNYALVVLKAPQKILVAKEGEFFKVKNKKFRH